VVAGLALVIAACGGASSAQVNAWVIKVNHICYTSDLALGVTPKKVAGPKAFGREIQRDNPIYAKELARLRAATAPSQDSAGYGHLLDAVAKENAILRGIVPPLLADNLVAARKYSVQIVPAAKVEYSNAEALGLVICAKSW
jgi:hypothetical protein